MQTVLPWKWSAVTSAVHCVTFLCSLPVGHQFKWCPHVCLLLSSLLFLHTTMAFGYSLSCTAPLACVVCWCKLSKWQILVAQTQSRHQSMAVERDTAWRPGWLIDCFLACGVHAVTFISPHSADIKCKLLKLLHKYINKVRI